MGRTDLPGTEGTDLLELAESTARIFLTLNKDFWQIAIQRGSPLEQSGVILFRIHPATPGNLKPLLNALDSVGAVWAGHIAIITVDGVQMLAARRK